MFLKAPVTRASILNENISFCRFNIDKPFVFQMTNVLSNRVGAHASVLDNASDAGPALICLPVLTENQVYVDGQLTGRKSQSENLIGQKKIVTQRAAVGVSIFNFRGVSSQVIFQNSTPSLQFVHSIILHAVSKLTWRSPILCLLHRKF